MEYKELADQFEEYEGVEQSTMMGSPCLRYKGDFIAMMFAKQESLIIKVSAERVNEIIEQGEGNEFNYTKKRFKEWVLIPLELEERYIAYIDEALAYAKSKHDV